MITTTSTISFERQAVPPIIQAVQGDSGRNILFNISDYAIPEGAEAYFYIQKPSGNAIYNAAEIISSGSVNIPLDTQCLAERGENYGQVRIVLDGVVVTSFDFILNIKSFRGDEAIESETEMDIFDRVIEQAKEEIEEFGAGLSDRLAKGTGRRAIIAGEIDSNTASGQDAFAQGYNTASSGNNSHSEGANTVASGIASHAEGRSTVASGTASHTSGYKTEAAGNNSTALGNNTKASRADSLVFGKYNIVDETGMDATQEGEYVEIVGNGTGEEARSNARTLDWEGNEKIAGKMTVGKIPTADMDVATKKYVDEIAVTVDANGVMHF